MATKRVWVQKPDGLEVTAPEGHELTPRGGYFPAPVQDPDRKICRNCNAWRPIKGRDFFGGCARSGQTTLHYGDIAYNNNTTDLSSCSQFERKL